SILNFRLGLLGRCRAGSQLCDTRAFRPRLCPSPRPLVAFPGGQGLFVDIQKRTSLFRSTSSDALPGQYRPMEPARWPPNGAAPWKLKAVGLSGTLHLSRVMAEGSRCFLRSG